MKKSLYFGIAALAALALTGCQKEANVNEPGKKMVTVTLIAQKAGDETRTAANEGTDKVTYEWTDEDITNLKVVTVEEKSGKEVLTLVENSTATISSDKKTLTVTATVEEMSTLRAAISGGWTNDGLKAKVMASQSPLSGNFDPNADVLVAEDVTVDGLDNALLTFNRPVTMNKMTLKNMVPGEKVYEITITSDNNLVGYYEGGKMNGQSGGNSITLSYENLEVGSNGEFPVYFVTMPNEANTLTVVVKSDKYVYTKTFGTVDFTVGKFSKFAVNLPAGQQVVETNYTGDWVITGTNNSVVYAAKAYVSGNNLAALGVKFDAANEEIASVKVSEIKMHFDRVTEGEYVGLYTIKDASGNYLYAAGTGTSNTLKGAPTLNGNDYYWSVEKEPNGTYTIKATKSSNRNIMRFNPTNGIFSCYGSGQNAVTLYPYSWVVEDEDSQPSGDGTLESPYNVAAAVAYAESLGTSTSPNNVYIQGIISQIPNNGTYGSNGYATFYISDDGSATGYQFEGYQILYLGNTNWTSGKTNIKVGDEVILCGKVVMYYGTAEISKAGYLYSLNGVTGDEPDPEYTITVASTEHGNVTPSATSATEGTEITLTITPATGYELNTLTVTNASGAAVTVTNNKFTMPASNVTVTATFKEKTVVTGDVYSLYSDTLTEGDYLIVYGGYAMKASVSNGRLDYAEVDPLADEIVDPDASIIWHIAPSGNYWTIYNANVEKYAAGTGAKNKAQLLADGTDDKSLWTVTGDETYEFVNKANAAAKVNSNLRNNGDYGFACYATSTGGALSLYKKN